MVLEFLFVFALALTTGYQAGKAGAKQEAIADGGYCVPTALETQGCYQVKKVSDERLAKKLQEK